MDSQERVAVRVLLLDPDSRVLMFEGRDLSDASDTARYWFTAGGGTERGETLIAAAERELREETGHTGLRLVGPFHRREFDFMNHGEPQHQIEHFFAARTGNTQVHVEGWTDLERRAVTSSRWVDSRRTRSRLSRVLPRKPGAAHAPGRHADVNRLGSCRRPS